MKKTQRTVICDHGELHETRNNENQTHYSPNKEMIWSRPWKMPVQEKLKKECDRMSQVEVCKPEIFTTGAFLHPMKIKNGNGDNIWVWVVADFDGDSFRDGEEFNPPKSAETLEELLGNTTG